ncbi:MAG: hypothetical protein PHV37_09460 [Candidatus Gastranaerophilales bacterium]|nr:hypothetical protein [Candidatus Gastranaerophilales bacterium]
MANMIITLSGKQFSGKDTVAKILLNELRGFNRIGLGDAIKLEYANQKGLTLEEIEKNKSSYRPDLIALGDQGRAISPDYWIKYVIKQNGNIIVPDVRMPREYEFFKKHGAFKIRVESSYEARSKRGKIVKGNDNTETALDNIKDWDYIITNDATYEDLVKDSYDLVDAINQRFDMV